MRGWQRAAFVGRGLGPSVFVPQGFGERARKPGPYRTASIPQMPGGRDHARALLLYGEEAFLVEEEARRRLDLWRADLVSDFGFEALDPGTVTMAKLRDALLQAPFLDPFRVIAVRQLPGRRCDSLAPALKELPETTRLIITVAGRTTGANALVKAVKALRQGEVVDFPRLRGRQFNDWVAQRARELRLPPSLGATVARMSPADLGVVDSELRKLAAFRDATGGLDQAAIDGLLVGGREEEVFRLTDHLLPRPDPTAFRSLRELVRGGQAPTSVAYRLARHLALVLEVHARKERGESLTEIQAVVLEHPFVVQKAFEAATGADAARLEAGLRALLDYEWEVKSGQLDAELGLEGVLARL